MGSCGFSSSDSDRAWDFIRGTALDLQAISQAEADTLLERAFAGELTIWDWDEKETALGVVVKLLEQGLFVNAANLSTARAFAEQMKGSQKYLDLWSDEAARKKALDIEIQQIDMALTQRTVNDQ